jgi:hypothetical protein
MTVTQSKTTDEAIKAEIRRQLAIAKAKRGNDWQVQSIENSWVTRWTTARRCAISVPSTAPARCSRG